MRELPVWKMMLSIFAVCGLIFGLISVASFAGARASRWNGAIWSGLVFGGAMSVIIGGMHYVWGRRSGKGRVPSVRQAADVVLEGDLTSVTVAAEQALRALNPRSIEISGTAPVRMTASTRITWKSFGERIEVSVTMVGERRAVVQFSTRPLLATTFIDYGKGMDNVNRFVEALRARDSGPAQEPRVPAIPSA